MSKIKPIIQDEESDEDDDSFLYKGAGGDIEMQALKEERSMAKQRDKEVAQLAVRFPCSLSLLSSFKSSHPKSYLSRF